MAYTLVENFIQGVDRTRPRAVGPSGSLWAGINGHITRGGDFEKRKAFVARYALPAGTFGLAKSASNRLTVFGSDAAPTMPSDVDYVRLQHPTIPSMAMRKIASWDLFNGKQYVIPQYDNLDYRAFYDGTIVADWGLGGANPSGFGTIVRTHKRKVYSPIGSLLWFSELDSGSNFDTGASGSGFVNVSNHQSGSDSVTGLSVYQNQLAIFSRLVIQLWNMADDDASNAPAQYLFETGTRAPRSITGFGDIDVFYLADSGVRSLRARSGTDLAGVNDVGTPIDTLIEAWVATLTDADIENAVGIVEPKEGRYWLAIAGRVFVFTYFPSKKVSAWTWYEPGFTITDFVNLNGKTYARAGNFIYEYGGSAGSTYERCRVTAELPFISGGKPGTYKQLTGFDFVTRGEWDVKLYINPDEEDGRDGGDYEEFVDIGAVEGNTFIRENIGAAAHATHVAPKFVHEDDGYASISQFAIHNNAAEAAG
jgi:hypothetical protein